jgi:hypothetical protein
MQQQPRAVAAQLPELCVIKAYGSKEIIPGLQRHCQQHRVAQDSGSHLHSRRQQFLGSSWCVHVHNIRAGTWCNNSSNSFTHDVSSGYPMTLHLQFKA